MEKNQEKKNSSNHHHRVLYKKALLRNSNSKNKNKKKSQQKRLLKNSRIRANDYQHRVSFIHNRKKYNYRVSDEAVVTIRKFLNTSLLINV